MLLRVLPVVAAVLLMSFPNVVRSQTLEIGDPFPNWSLVDQTGSTVSSIGYTGRSYLLWFCPAAMTPACTAEGRNFRDNFGGFERAGVDVLGVSFDPPEVNGIFAKAEDFPFPLLSDTEDSLATRVGAIASEAGSRPRGMTFVVGSDGNVVKIYKNVNSMRHAEKVLLDLGVPLQ